MSDRDKQPSKARDARDDGAKPGEPIGESERAQRRIEHLYVITKLLMRFESVERIVPDVIAVIAQTLSIRSAVFIEESADTPVTIVWQAAGESPDGLDTAKIHAQAAYKYLVRSDGDLQREEAKTLGRDVPTTKDFVVLPLVVDHGRIFGALQLECTVSFSEQDLVFINALVNQLAIGLDRLRTEQALQRVEREDRFLGEVGSLLALATALDFEETLRRISRLALRDLADLCVLEFANERGTVQQLDIASSDPAKAEIAEALKRFPLDRNRPHLSSEVLRLKQSQLISQVSEDTLHAVTQNEEHRRLVQALGLTSLMGVPLVVQDRLVGALVLASCRRERCYRTADLRLLEEVGRRAALALENARLHGAVAQAVETRDDVLAIVAHDLRNPLHTILMQASFLQREDAQQGPSARRAASAIERAAHRMNRLIQDLLDVSVIEANKLALEQGRMPAGEVVSEAVESHQGLASSGSLDLRTDLGVDVPDIWCDRERLLQVFENLIGNAIKFTTPGGQIVVGAKPRDHEVLFWVADSGAGIAREDVPHVFDRFWQARKSRRAGAGLGLLIVKGIVDAHGGRVWVESTPGRGSIFFFTIPTAARLDERRGAPTPHA